MKSTAAAGIVFFALGPMSFVQAEESSIVGRYTGTFQAQDNYMPNRVIGVTLVIQKVTDGKVEATGQLHARGPCFAQFPMVGTVKGDQLQLQTVRRAGKDSDCTMVLRMTVDGSRLVGTTGRGLPVRLSK